MRLADYVAVGFVRFTAGALLLCASLRVREVAARVALSRSPVRGQQPVDLPSGLEAALEEMMGDAPPNWRENDRFIRKAGEQ